MLFAPSIARLRWLIILLACFAAHLAPAAPIRVACVGDSITFGAGIKDRARDSYPAQLQALLGDGYEVRNFGVSGRTMLRHGDFPWWNEKACAAAHEFNPDIVVIKLGTNDSKPQNWKFKNEFGKDTAELVQSFQELPSRPRVLLCLPVPAFKTMWGINPDIIKNEAIPILRQTAAQCRIEMVDLYTPHLDKAAWFPDAIHPDATGAGSLARAIAGTIRFEADPAYDFAASLSKTPVKLFDFFGYRGVKFTVAGRECTVVQPWRCAAKRPIAWRAEFFGHEPQTDLALLERGFHVVYVNAQNLFGAPEAMKAWEAFHERLAKAGLTGKITPIAMSRGGLYAYNWAALHPETVACIYADAPVCDLKSWPGGKGQGDGSKAEWARLMKVYGFKDEAEALAFKGSPIDILEPLAKAGIPLLHVVGEADTTVPVAENTDVLAKRYKALGGSIEVIRKPNINHHPHSLANPAPIVEFILKNN